MVPLRDGARRDRDVLVGAEDLVRLLDRVELEADRRRHQVQHRSPRQRDRARRQEQRLRRVVLPEPHDLEHRERVVPGGVVHDLEHPDLADLLAEGQRVHGDAGVAEAGVDAGRVEAGATLQAGGVDPVVHAVAGGLREQQRHVRRVHHVLPAREHAADVVDDAVGAEVGVGGVADAVGLEVEQRVRILRGDHAGRGAAAELAGVVAGLAVGVDPQPGQLELGMGHDGGHGVDPDGARRPLDHSVAHGVPLVDGRAERSRLRCAS